MLIIYNAIDCDLEMARKSFFVTLGSFSKRLELNRTKRSETVNSNNETIFRKEPINKSLNVWVK